MPAAAYITGQAQHARSNVGMGFDTCYDHKNGNIWGIKIQIMYIYIYM